MISHLIGSQLLAKLADCPNDAYPHGVTESADGTLLIDAQPVQRSAEYGVQDNVRNRDAHGVNTIDSDWTVFLT